MFKFQVLRTGLNMLNEKNLSYMSSGITLKNNEIEYIIKVITCLEDRGNLMKGTTKRINCQEGWFIELLMRVELSLTELVLATDATI